MKYNAKKTDIEVLAEETQIGTVYEYSGRNFLRIQDLTNDNTYRITFLSLGQIPCLTWINKEAILKFRGNLECNLIS